MTELNSATFILMAEALSVLIVLAVYLYFRNKNKQGKDLEEIDQFITRLAEEEILKCRLLETILLDECGVDAQKAALVLRQVSSSESELLQKIIQMFLQRNPGLLPEIESLITHISDPYYKLLAELQTEQKSATKLSPNSKPDNNLAKDLEIKLAGLEKINQQLTKRLNTAMQTIDDITTEYTRVFSGHQAEIELEASSKRMLQIFQETEQHLNFTDSE